MTFSGMAYGDNDGPPCEKCGSKGHSLSVSVRRDEGYTYGWVTLCETCLFKAVLGDVAYYRAVNRVSVPIKDEGKVIAPKKWWQL
jgi:hypothetical protein